MIRKQPFDRQKHVYRNDAFAELVKDAIRFFNGTPVVPLPPPDSFSGTGVYALYYTGSDHLYKEYGAVNRLSYRAAIYVGKAVPKGWRRARSSDNPLRQSQELCHRLKEHSRSIEASPDLSASDFMCRFVIFEDTGSDMIGTIEAALIKLHRPLWNTTVDGFGNHDPGRGRYEQAKSDWDVIHPGRPWVRKCKGAARSRSAILADIKTHFKGLSNTP